jgi:hypothetical protein
MDFTTVRFIDTEHDRGRNTEWERKELHGTRPYQLEQEMVDKDASKNG